MKVELRSLDPEADYDLFREAHNWRRPSRVSADQVSFDEFIRPDPAKAVLGLFNGDFLAVYLIREWMPQHYDMHFTAKRSAPRDYLVAGGIQITNWLIKNGAVEVSAFIIARNRALKRFLEDCGYKLARSERFEDSPREWLRYVA